MSELRPVPVAGRGFPRACRLTARGQFLAVYRQGRRVRSENMTVFALPNAVGSTRLGITVTRRVGGAVHRNRFKRVLREVFRLHRDALGEGLDIVVNAHPGAYLVPFATLEQEFLNAFARLARRRAP